jgi:uncharacterized protein YtpQ (UPF0354 family)
MSAPGGTIDVDSVVPRIKHTNFLEALAARHVPADQMPVTEPLVADLLITYAVETPAMFQMLSANQQQALGLTPDALRQAALANLQKRLGALQVAGQPPVLLLSVGDDLEACLLLVDPLWEALAAQVPAEMVVAVPTRSIVLVTSSTSREGLQVVREAIPEAQKTQPVHSLTRHLLVRRDRRWAVFE